MKTNFHIPRDPVLKNFINVIWQVNGHPHYSSETIFPQGIAEIIFSFSESPLIDATIGDKEARLQKCFINGYNTKTIRLRIPQHHFFFGMRVHPHVIRQLFFVPAGELANESVDLTLLDKTADTLWHRLKEAPDFPHRIKIITQWLKQKAFSPPGRELAIIHFLNDEKNTVHNSSSLSKTLYYSPRQLSRKFIEFTGMNTEEFLQYKKFLKALHLTHSSPLSLTQVAHECNFFDQSHFIRVFRSYSDITPGEYRKIKSFLPGHIYQ
jgi:AraC-like DNA-binding protein